MTEYPARCLALISFRNAFNCAHIRKGKIGYSIGSTNCDMATLFVISSVFLSPFAYLYQAVAAPHRTTVPAGQ
jgi:hypothetical protein